MTVRADGHLTFLDDRASHRPRHSRARTCPCGQPLEAWSGTHCTRCGTRLPRTADRGYVGSLTRR